MYYTEAFARPYIKMRTHTQLLRLGLAANTKIRERNRVHMCVSKKTQVSTIDCNPGLCLSDKRFSYVQLWTERDFKEIVQNELKIEPVHTCNKCINYKWKNWNPISTKLKNMRSFRIYMKSKMFTDQRWIT